MEGRWEDGDPTALSASPEGSRAGGSRPASSLKMMPGGQETAATPGRSPYSACDRTCGLNKVTPLPPVCALTLSLVGSLEKEVRQRASVLPGVRPQGPLLLLPLQGTRRPQGCP